MATIVSLPVLRAGQTIHELPDPDGDVFEAVAVSLDAARVRKLVRSLPEPERHVITWRYGLGGTPALTCRQVAERLGISVGTAWNVEQRALGYLREPSAAAQLAA